MKICDFVMNTLMIRRLVFCILIFCVTSYLYVVLKKITISKKLDYLDALLVLMYILINVFFIVRVKNK